MQILQKAHYAQGDEVIVMAENTAEKKEKVGFFKNLKIEFKKIIWPDKKDVAKQTLLIIVVTIILGVLIKLLDTGIQALIGLIA